MKEIDKAHRKDGRWIFAPVDDITTSKDGRICCGPRWWSVTKNNEVMFFDYYSSPQCNSNRSIVERIAKGFNAPETSPVYIPMAFIPHRCDE